MKQMKESSRTTLREIAQKAGCSLNTVSLAVRGSSRISEEMRSRISQIAQELNYIPNFAARHLRNQRSGIIGVYSGPIRDAVRIELVNHLLQELHTAEYRPMLGIEQDIIDPGYKSPWMETFRLLNVEALVVICQPTVNLPEWTNHIPVILLGGEPDETLTCDYLALDRAEGARIGIEHLISRQHRDIMVCCDPGGNYYRGCIETLRRHRCKIHKCPLPNPNKIDLQQARLLGYTLARQSQGPTATIFGDSGLAAGFMCVIRDRQGRVPEDMAVIGYDYFPWADMLAVPLTTVEQPIYSMASAAVDLVRRRLAEPDAPPIHVIQPHNLVIRKSTGL
jgi:LacI family transcriptional regulator